MNDGRMIQVHESRPWLRGVRRLANGRRIGCQGFVGVAALACFPTIALSYGGTDAQDAIRATQIASADVTDSSGAVVPVEIDNDLVVDLAANDQLINIGTSGQVCLFTFSTADLVADVTGYVPSGGAPAPVTPLARARLLDTRLGPGYQTVDGTFMGMGQRPAGSTLALTVAGRGGVPADADAVEIEIGVWALAPGYVAIYPCGGARPMSSFGEFTSLTPARILDTRDGTGRQGLTGPLGTGETIDVQIAGQGGVAASGVAAVVLNATVTEPTEPSYLTVWPTGIERPDISNLNYELGQSVPNLVTVAVGANGKVSAYNLAGSTHVVFDVVGYYADAIGPTGSRFHAINPYRYFDTRDGTGGVSAQPIGPDSVLSFGVVGRGSVPAGVTAVVMNVTATQPTMPSYLTVYPADVASRPLASNLNFQPGQSVPNLVTVRVPSSGVIDFYNLAGSVHVIADVVGYYDSDRSTDAGRFAPLPPSRTFDSRDLDQPLGPDSYGVLQMAGWNGVPVQGAGAVVINTTVTQPTEYSYLTVFPDDMCEIPLASNLNYRPAQTVPNLVIVRLSTMSGCALVDGAVDAYNAAGTVHVIADVFGYFTSAATTSQDRNDPLPG